MKVLNNGDLVILKSGSPIMTVKTLCFDSRIAECSWFDKRTPYSGFFGFEQLIITGSISEDEVYFSTLVEFLKQDLGLNIMGKKSCSLDLARKIKIKMLVF